MFQSATIPATPALEGEIWLRVPDYETRYLVSNRGRVWSTRSARLLKPALRGHPGYERLYVTLCSGSRATNWSTTVHQLVMLAFVGPPEPGQEVRHLDGNPFNNHWEPGNEAETRAAGGNLFYGSHAANQQDMVKHGRAMGCGKLGSEHPKAKLTEEIVRLARSEYAAGATELALAAKYGVNGSTMHRLLVRKTWQHVA